MDRAKWGTQTSIPWREWIICDSRISRRLITFHSDGQLTWGAAGAAIDWDGTYLPFAYFGKDRVAGAHDGYFGIAKPMAADFIDDDQLNTLFTVGIRATIGVKERTGNKDHTQFRAQVTFIQENDVINWDKGSGKFYNGVDNWAGYPIGTYPDEAQLIIPGEAALDAIIIAELPREYHAFLSAKSPGGDTVFNINDPAFAENQTDLFRNGLMFETVNFLKPPATWGFQISNRDLFTIRPNSIKIYYLNGCVNSLSRRRMPTAGNVDLEINGLGFTIPEADLAAYCPAATNFQHKVAKIHFIGREGQGPAIVVDGENYNGYSLVFTDGDFTQTNTALMIPAMPAMVEGTYYIQLQQHDWERGNANYYYTYAGDWRTNNQGRARPGARFVFAVSDATIPEEPIVPYFKWAWKYDDWIFEYYAPIDTRATEIFWDGRVLGVSSVTRGVDDRTGLFTISDPSVELANHDMHFSRLLSKYICKNQMIEITYGRGTEPAAWHEAAFFGIVDDHQIKGPQFSVQMKDWMQRYFKGQLPRFIVDSDTYPYAKDGALGQPIPELIGEHSLTTGSTPGAIEALCVDPRVGQYIYVMAGGPLRSVPEVYGDGTLIDAADYTLYIEEDGKQYVQFDADQEDKKITFNCQGYMFDIWNSAAGGYVQNPAYIIAFYLSLIMEIPIDFIDLDAIDILAQIFEDSGWGTAGKLAMTMLESPEAILQSMLYSFGIKFWQKRDGTLALGRKDISNLETDLFFHTQIEVTSPPEKAFNLLQAINTVQANWNFFPACDLYGGAKTAKDDASIELFETEMGPSEPWVFPCITSDSLAEQRILEDLLKLAFGDRRIKFSIPLEYIGPTEVFDNFRLQDPYGLSWTKSGELGRYYYVLSLTYEWQGRTISIEAEDLQWLLQQYFIFGDEDAMPEEWPDARPTSYAMYGYLCDEDTFQFSDGTPGKILIDENLVDQE